MGFISESFEEFKNNINERVVKPSRGGFTKNQVEDLLKKYKSMELRVDGEKYFINPYDHDNGVLGDASEFDLFASDIKGNETQIKFNDIEEIRV